MICDYCCHGGNCLKSNPSREVCDMFRPMCKACYYNKTELATITTKERQGKKVIDVPKTIQKHRCVLTGLELDPTDFCSKGKRTPR